MFSFEAVSATRRKLDENVLLWSCRGSGCVLGVVLAMMPAEEEGREYTHRRERENVRIMKVKAIR